MTIGQNIRRWRFARGHTSQTAFAEQIGVTPSRLSDWETDKSVPALDTLLLFAEMLDVPLDAIVASRRPTYDAQCARRHADPGTVADAAPRDRDYDIDPAVLTALSNPAVAAQVRTFLQFPDSLREWLLQIPLALKLLRRTRSGGYTTNWAMLDALLKGYEWRA